MKVKLQKVRLSFPSLFKPKSVNNSEPKYAASFLLNKQGDAAQVDALRQACVAVAKEKWPTKIPSGVKYCVHDGSEKDYAGYGPDVIYISASNAMPVLVVDEQLQPITESDRRIYAGCFVNVSIRLWAQDNAYGKRINAQLVAVQFAADGEAFGEKPVDAAEEFAVIKNTDALDAAAPASTSTSTTSDDDNIPF